MLENIQYTYHLTDNNVKLCLAYLPIIITDDCLRTNLVLAVLGVYHQSMIEKMRQMSKFRIVEKII